MTVETPKYLAEPGGNGGLQYGRLTFEPGDPLDGFVIEAEPMVLEMAKRLFPGCRTGNTGAVEFKATRRAVGDLNWLMLRFPLEIAEPERFERHRQGAIEHALRREANQRTTPIEQPAGFVGTLLPFQQEGVAFLAANERCLLADDMGLGKTVMGLAALAHVEGWPAVVVTPTSVQRQWMRMIETFLAIEEPGRLFTAAPTVYQLKGLTASHLPAASIYLIHYGLLRAWGEALREVKPKAVVFDEAQELRRTVSLKYSEASLISGEARHVWGLSGTPIYNYGDEIWAVLNALDFHCLSDRESFTREWCDGYGGRVVRKPAVLGDYLRREGLVLRRRKVEVQAQLPPKRRVVIEIDHDRSEYLRMAEEAIALARGYGSITSWHEKGLTKRRIDEAARQATGVAKAPWAAEFIFTLLEAGERPLVFSYHHAVHDEIARILQRECWSVARITGVETAAQKDKAVAAFASGEVKAVLLSLRTAAGLDGLQEAGTCVVFAELDWSPAIHAQCEDRLARMGANEGLDSILCYYLVASTGSDEVMQDALGIKVGQFTGLMGDEGESEADRDLARRAAEAKLGALVERMAGEE